MSLRLSPRWSTANFKLPSTSVPRPLPATRMTKRSFGPSPKISSTGTRASEQPSTTANGRCFGMPVVLDNKPRSRGSTGIIRCTTALSSESFSSSAAKARFPSFSRWKAASLSGGRGLAGVSRASYRYIISTVFISVLTNPNRHHLANGATTRQNNHSVPTASS